MLKLSILTLSILGSFAQEESLSRRDAPQIDWKPCGKFECGSYQVPLDYADHNAGNATLALSRYKSYNKPHLGTLFTNPGGPGGSGTSEIQGGAGDILSNVTNGQYDIVSWDPRGVNMSAPGLSCGFPNETALKTWLGATIAGDGGVEARGNFTDQADLDAFYKRVAETDARIEELGKKCAESDGGFLKYMGTVAVVRDMVSLADYLEGPGSKINFWGISYGTVIGNYFVNMFPDRVGRVILDGVVDTAVYATQPSYKLWSASLDSTQATFEGFVQACAQAGPEGCAIAQKGSTSASISKWVHDLIDTSYDEGKYRYGISSIDTRSTLMHGMYTPGKWATLAENLEAIWNLVTNNTAPSSGTSSTNGTAKRGDGNVIVNGTNSSPMQAANMGITCVDSIDQDGVTMKEVFDELVRVTHEKSPLFGTLMPSMAGFYCHNFPVRAVERFTGPFNHTLAYPIMVIGNEADPITPFASAKSVSDTLGDSAYLVQQDDFGHSSLAERSDCTQGVIKNYLVWGALPSKGKFCGTNQVLFPGPGVTKGTLAAALGTDSEDGNNSNDSQVKKLRKERNLLAGVAGSLGLAALFLAGILAFTCMRNRKNTRYAPPPAAAAFAVKHDYVDGRGSTDASYSDPWEGKRAVY